MAGANHSRQASKPVTKVLDNGRRGRGIKRDGKKMIPKSNEHKSGTNHDAIAPAPAFLRRIGEEAKRKGRDKLTMRQIDAEIRAARWEKRLKHGSQKVRP